MREKEIFPPQRKWCRPAVAEEIPPSPTLPFYFSLTLLLFLSLSFLFPSLGFLSFSLYFSISIHLSLTEWCFICFPPQIKGSLFSSSSICWSFLLRLVSPQTYSSYGGQKILFFLSCCGCCPYIHMSTSKSFQIKISLAVIPIYWLKYIHNCKWKQSTRGCRQLFLATLGAV